MRITTKLFSAFLLLLISMSMMVCVSFAWFTLSDSPALSGIKITIGVDTSIKIAPNVSETIEGVVVNYPGDFTSTASLSAKEGALLSPVSTADGVHWFVPIYDDQGNITTQFVEDITGEYVNTEQGGYVMLDFWVVSPLDNVFLRLCTGDEDETGSYVVQLPESIKNFTNETGYHLDDSYATLSSSVRVGFLVNENVVETSEDMSAYAASADYQDAFKSLRGVYDDTSEKFFQIYEPNGLIHPNEGHSVIATDEGLQSVVLKNGDYWITHPVGLDEQGNPQFVDVAERLIVQSECGWMKNSDGSLKIDEMYQAYLKSSSNPSLDDFYQNTLNNSYLQYVYAGLLFENTYDLYMASHMDYATANEVSVMRQTNAINTSEMAVLKKNTPQRIRMFVWIEGQDVDCNSSAANQSIAIRLELAGSTGA